MFSLKDHYLLCSPEEKVKIIENCKNKEILLLILIENQNNKIIKYNEVLLQLKQEQFKISKEIFLSRLCKGDD